MLSRKFAAPKSKDVAQWEKVQFLIEHGFRFYSVYEPSCGGMMAVKYPDTLDEAKKFVQIFASQMDKQFHSTVLQTMTVDGVLE